MSISVSNYVSTNKYNPPQHSIKTSGDFSPALNQRGSATGNAPVAWTAQKWDEFLEDFVKNYSDEKFAAALQIGYDGNISTEKKINWQATGKNELTQDQIDYLKENYDVENMDGQGQDYYNLIADLTNMDVISGQDTAKQHVGALPIGVVRHSDRSYGEMADENGDFSVFSGNIYQNFMNRVKDNTHTLELLKNSTSFGTAKEYLNYIEYFEEESRIYNNLISIFDKIIR